MRAALMADPPFSGAAGNNIRLGLRGTVHLFEEAEIQRESVTL